MIAIDTDVLVRFLVKDHEIQYRASHKLFATTELFIADTVVLETERVLRYAYELDAETICDAFRKVFGLPNVYLSNARRMAQVIDWYAAGFDFADALHLIASEGCEYLKTFDADFIRRAAKLAAGNVAKP